MDPIFDNHPYGFLPVAVFRFYFLRPSDGHLEVHCTYNLLSNCSYNLNISPITIVTLDIIGL